MHDILWCRLAGIVVFTFHNGKHFVRTKQKFVCLTMVCCALLIRQAAAAFCENLSSGPCLCVPTCTLLGSHWPAHSDTLVHIQTQIGAHSDTLVHIPLVHIQTQIGAQSYYWCTHCCTLMLAHIDITLSFTKSHFAQHLPQPCPNIYTQKHAGFKTIKCIGKGTKKLNELNQSTNTSRYDFYNDQTDIIKIRELGWMTLNDFPSYVFFPLKTAFPKYDWLSKIFWYCVHLECVAK